MLARSLAEQRDFKSAVIELVRETKGGVSFAEIEDLFSPFMDVHGEQAVTLPGYPNIILWMNMSSALCQVIEELVTDKVLTYSPVEWLVYVADRKILSLPLATRPEVYDTPHWLPVAFDPGESFPPRHQAAG